jgi:hypothetical protein
MKLPTVVRPSSGMSGLLFRPHRKIEIFHRAAERSGAAPHKVAEVLTDGVQGKVAILDPAFAGVIEPLFNRSQLAIAGGATRGRVSYDGSPRRLRPWKPETVAYVVSSVLGRFDLRGEVCALSPR